MSPTHWEKFIAAFMNRSNWKYQIKVEDESNLAIKGILTYREDHVPGEAKEIVTPIGRYSYDEYSNLHTESGWLIESEERLIYSESGVPLPDESLEQGWLEDASLQTQYRILEGWVFLPDYNAWVSGDRLSAFLEYYEGKTSIETWRQH